MKSRDEIRRRIETIQRLGLPDCRYRAARYYTRERLRASFRDDESTKTLTRFLEARRGRRNKVGSRRHGVGDPDLEMAFRIRFGRLAHFGVLLEAYLLTGAGSDAIAAKFGFSTETVFWFQQAFFDVEKLLQFPGRVLFDVIGIQDAAGRPKWDRSKTLQIIGYTLKAAALDQVLRIQSTPTGKIEPDAWLKLQAEAMASLQGFLAAASLDPRTAKSALGLQKLTQHGVGKDQEDSLDVLHKHIRALMDETPWAVGDDGAKMLAGTTLGRFDEGAAELRDEQVIRLSTGEMIPNLDEELLTELPPPRAKNAVGETRAAASPLESLSNRNQR
jgi:hypothetical protein